ncbi:MAG: YHYH protein [Halieaceae bacterium]
MQLNTSNPKIFTAVALLLLTSACIGNRNDGNVEAHLYAWGDREQPIASRMSEDFDTFGGYFRGSVIFSDLLQKIPHLDTTTGAPYLIELCDDGECQYLVTFPEAFTLVDATRIGGFAVINPLSTAIYHEVENTPEDIVRETLDGLAPTILLAEAPQAADGVIDYLDLLRLDYELEPQYLSLFIDSNLANRARVASRYDSGITLSEILTSDYDPGAIDITNDIFVDTSGDCGYYALSYTADARDVLEDTEFVSNVEITYDEESCTLSSNGIPNHDFQDANGRFATTVSEQSISVTIPRLPEQVNSVTALSQRNYDAIMLNGVALDLLSAGCYDPQSPQADAEGNTPIGCTLEDGWLLDPMYSESSFGTDGHNAHSQPNGLYHYHGNPVAMFDDNPGANGSPVIGFAADGFPIYGNYFYDSQTRTMRKAVSGYRLRAGSRPDGANDPGGIYDGTYIDDFEFTDAGDLDECNGMTIDGQYGYYVTDSYPWVLNCFKGTVDNSFSK